MKKVFAIMTLLVCALAAKAEAPISMATGRYRVTEKIAPAMKNLNDGQEVARAGQSLSAGNMQPMLTLVGEGRMVFLKQGETVQGVMQVKEMMLVKNAAGKPWWVMASHVTRIR